MTKITHKDILEAQKISTLFSKLSEENKTMVMVYLSALRDKELADEVVERKKGE